MANSFDSIVWVTLWPQHPFDYILEPCFVFAMQIPLNFYCVMCNFGFVLIISFFNSAPSQGIKTSFNFFQQCQKSNLAIFNRIGFGVFSLKRLQSLLGIELDEPYNNPSDYCYNEGCPSSSSNGHVRKLTEC